MSAPPAYHEHTFTLAHDALVDDLHASHSTPQYSADAPPSERVLQTAATSSSPVPSVFQSSSSADFIFKGYALEINLGPKLWNLSLPAYGHNGYVEGTVKLYKNCTYTHRLVVSVSSPFCHTLRHHLTLSSLAAYWPSFCDVQGSRCYRGRLLDGSLAHSDDTSP